MSPTDQPVRVYLAVQRKSRGWSPRLQWWTCEVLKPETFTAADFRPLAVQETNALYGSVQRFDFELENVDPARRVVVARPYEIALSKAWPLERTLLGCGWEQCDPPGAEILGVAP